MRTLIAGVLALLAGAAQAADPSSMRFEVRLLGLKAGTIEIAANVTDRAYAARTRFRTAGVVGALKQVRADVSVQGRVAGGAFRPQTYSEAIDDGSRVTNVQVQFAPGQPRLISGDTGSSAPPADTSKLTSAIDPLTLLYVALRDQPRDEVCRFEADVYDGHRHAVITLKGRQPSGDTITCNGSYRRVAGYSDSEREKRNVGITVTYVPAGDVMRAERVAFDTKLGPAVMDRR
ncbi:MAG: DUF3108 domain-containing protein [Roseovarius sp.]|uniref:DUF3108 domain-containing protein n=1 Tax=Roseobacteraceae TaxID=2854170 RepID=UPI0032EBD37C